MELNKFNPKRPSQGRTRPFGDIYTGARVDAWLQDLSDQQVASLFPQKTIGVTVDRLLPSSSNELAELAADSSQKVLLPPGANSDIWYKPTFQALHGNLGDNFYASTKEQYEAWLVGYLREGGKINHHQDKSFYDEQTPLFTAIRDFTFDKPLYGANSVRILVPNGVKMMGDDFGHSNVFLMDGYQFLGGGLRYVSFYSDLDRRLLAFT